MESRQKMDCKTAQQMITPYINRELTDRELEGFIDHIRDCKECYEELEIYFTIHFALQKLDEDKNVSYNIQKMLKDDLRTSERRVQHRKVARYYRFVLVVLAEAALLLTLFTRIQYWGEGTIEKTSVYRLLHGETSGTAQPRPPLMRKMQTEAQTEEPSQIQTEKPGQTENSRQPEKTVQPENSGQAEKNSQTENSSQAEKTRLIENSSQPEKTVQPGDSSLVLPSAERAAEPAMEKKAELERRK